MENLNSNSWIYKSSIPIPHNINDLLDLKPAHKDTIKMYGKEIELPRYQQSYGIDYKFSGKNHKAIDPPPELQYYWNYAKGLSQFDGHKFNQMFVNWYLDGSMYIGPHKDNEKQLIPNSPILSVSIGGSRTFRIRDNKNKIVKDIVLNNGDIIVMGGHFQKDYKHEIIKTKKLVNPRINITFRQFHE